MVRAWAEVSALNAASFAASCRCARLCAVRLLLPDEPADGAALQLLLAARATVGRRSWTGGWRSACCSSRPTATPSPPSSPLLARGAPPPGAVNVVVQRRAGGAVRYVAPPTDVGARGSDEADAAELLGEQLAEALAKTCCVPEVSADLSGLMGQGRNSPN